MGTRAAAHIREFHDPQRVADLYWQAIFWQSLAPVIIEVNRFNLGARPRNGAIFCR